MKRKILGLVAAFAIAASAFAPAAAEARDRHGGYYGRHHHDYYNHRRHHRDNDDAVVAGVVGLALGLTLGALASQPRPAPRASCYDDYRRCAPPPARYQGYDDRPVYYDDGYYEDPRAAYERDYGLAPEPRCDRQERVWDRATQRYVVMDAC